MNYRNAKYINDSGWIDCEIDHPDYGWVPYTLNPDDTDMTIDNNVLLAAMVANNDVAAYVPPSQEDLDAQAAEQVRNERNYRLAADVDPIAGNALRWAELTPEQQQVLATYRQALLHVPQQAGFPHNVVWPTKPE